MNAHAIFELILILYIMWCHYGYGALRRKISRLEDNLGEASVFIYMAGWVEDVPAYLSAGCRRWLYENETDIKLNKWTISKKPLSDLQDPAKTDTHD